MTTSEPQEMAARRAQMVSRDIASRGIKNRRVLDAMASVPREQFLPEHLAEFAYDDSPLPIAEGQTISQPYIVAAMVDAAELTVGDRVLEIGTGSGYGAAILGQIADNVVTIERHALLADAAAARLIDLGYLNIDVVVGDGTLGWPESAPYDAIIVTAGGPAVPRALLDQLAEGGRLVIPVGPESRGQELVRVRRHGDETTEEDLGPVRFVPLIGAQGWTPQDEPPALIVPTAPVHRSNGIAGLVAEVAEPFGSIADAELGPLLERIGDCSVVLLGEASHGTSEFYRMLERITRELILRKGFTVVAVEADWPDAARIDTYVRHRRPTGPPMEPFARFPTWMWRNREVATFVEWLRDHNATLEEPSRQVSFSGLDIYSLFTSRDAVLSYLAGIDPDAAAVARHRYSCLTPWQHDPAAYGRAVVTGSFSGCEEGVVATLTDLLRRRLEYSAQTSADFVDARQNSDDFVDAAQNAMVVAQAERYYRVMYSGSRASWNLRDQHMFETLKFVRAHRGPGAKVVVWEHNSHVGDASATEMGARGEHNVGMLARREFGASAFLLGFGTDHGTVAAATDWGGPMEIKSVRPSHPDSYERICHDTGIGGFMMHLRDPARPEVREELAVPRLERAIGVIYRPETELQSHYFQASLPTQFDEYVWIDATTAVTPLPTHEVAGAPDTYPFGL